MTLYSSQETLVQGLPSWSAPAILVEDEAQLMINERSKLRIRGATDFALATGDCFEIKYQPYDQSKSNYESYRDAAGGTLPAFYAPFAKQDSELSDLSYSVVAGPDDRGNEYRVQDGFNDADDGETLVVEVVNGVDLDFDFIVDSMMNPYSQIATTALSNKFNIKHLTGCNAASTSDTRLRVDQADDNTNDITDGSGGEVSGPTFTGPDPSDLGTIVPTLESNVLGTSDKYIEFKITTGKFWPAYGGTIEIALPYWYNGLSPSGVEQTASVFNSNSVCK